MCEYAAITHQVEHKISPHLRDELQWLPPPGLKDGDKVTFKATVVAEYAIWWAFTQSFTVGVDEPDQPLPASACCPPPCVCALRRVPFGRVWPKARCTRGCEETARVSHLNTKY